MPSRLPKSAKSTTARALAKSLAQQVATARTCAIGQARLQGQPYRGTIHKPTAKPAATSWLALAEAMRPGACQRPAQPHLACTVQTRQRLAAAMHAKPTQSRGGGDGHEPGSSS
jgi:hypothetical protein